MISLRKILLAGVDRTLTTCVERYAAAAETSSASRAGTVMASRDAKAVERYLRHAIEVTA
jgi:hypothetical protein